MKDKNKDAAKRCGIAGENAAAEYLRRKGFTILLRNLHVSHLEIDLLAENEDYLVFAEVKARTVPFLDAQGNSPYAVTPGMAVDYKKQKKLYTAAEIYLAEHPTSKQPRFDVLEVYLKPVSYDETLYKVLRIHHIEDAFGRV